MFTTLCIFLLVAGAYCDDDRGALIAQIFGVTATQDKENTQVSTRPANTTNGENSKGNKSYNLPDEQKADCNSLY